MATFIDALKGKTLHLNKVIYPSVNRLTQESLKYKNDSTEINTEKIIQYIFLLLGETISNYYEYLYNDRNKTSLNKYVKNITPRNAEYLTCSLASLFIIQILDDLENSLDFNQKSSEEFVSIIEERFLLSLSKREEEKHLQLWDLFLSKERNITSVFADWYDFYCIEILGLDKDDRLMALEDGTFGNDKAKFCFLFAKLLDDFRLRFAKFTGL